MNPSKNGIVVVNKPTNYTSRDIVNIISKKLNTKKVGHTGTLDPLASGVLVICIGRYTKLVEMLTSLEKEYIAEIKLGIKTDTLDITGKVIEEKQEKIKEEDILKVFKKFIGKYKMEVPAFSAIKVNGKKLYEYARNNEKVDLPIKEVSIYELELLEFHEDIIKFRAKVEKGTYIRSLIRDICKDLNTIGSMNSLVRTKQGNFLIEHSISLNEIETKNLKLKSLKEVMDIKEYEVNKEELELILNGNELTLNQKEDLLLMTYQKEEIALYKKEQNKYKVKVMLKIKNL